MQMKRFIFVSTNKSSNKRIILSIAEDMSNIIYCWCLNKFKDDLEI